MVFTGTNGRGLSTSTPLGAERVNQMWNSATALQRFTRQWSYEAGSASIIVANAVFVAMETQYRAEIAQELQSDHLPQSVTATAPDSHAWFVVCVCVLFVYEIR